MPQLCGGESCTIKLNTRTVRKASADGTARTKSVSCCLEAVTTQTSECR
jgi:hypothetical protein